MPPCLVLNTGKFALNQSEVEREVERETERETFDRISEDRNENLCHSLSCRNRRWYNEESRIKQVQAGEYDALFPTSSGSIDLGISMLLTRESKCYSVARQKIESAATVGMQPTDSFLFLVGQSILHFICLPVRYSSDTFFFVSLPSLFFPQNHCRC